MLANNDWGVIFQGSHYLPVHRIDYLDPLWWTQGLVGLKELSDVFNLQCNEIYLISCLFVVMLSKQNKQSKQKKFLCQFALVLFVQ